jgi:Arc/MetJ-type ribon-helix-helix transcriptional regulator
MESPQTASEVMREALRLMEEHDIAKAEVTVLSIFH